MNKLLILLVAATLCCCITSLHGCRCRSTVNKRIPPRIVKRIEMTPVSGHCRNPEILVFSLTGSKFCINPKAEWLPEFLRVLHERRALQAASSSTTPTTPTTSTDTTISQSDV